MSWRRLLVLLAKALLGVLAWYPVHALAQSRGFEYSQAEHAFSQLPLEERVHLQMLLTAAGYWQAVPNADFSTRLFDAIARFQHDAQLPIDGVLNAGELQLLASGSADLINKWGFQIIAHPAGGSIWVPLGMGLTQQSTENGFKYTDRTNRLLLTYDYYPHFAVRRSFDAAVADLSIKGFHIEYSKEYRDEFFVVSASGEKTDAYVRYHQYGQGGLGFSLYWSHDATDFHGERIATFISGSLWSSLTGAPFADPATIKPREQVVALPSQPIAPVAPSNPQPTPSPATPVSPPPVPQDKHQGSSGTGVFVSSDGLVLTNAHVVNDCTEIQIAPPQGAFVPAQIFGRDSKNDLAILKTGSSPLHFAALRSNIRLGENVEAFGYPLVAVLASSGNFTLGNVTALAGWVTIAAIFKFRLPCNREIRVAHC